METVLQAKDAVEWTYRGEGAVNLVLAYRGSSPKFVGKVLRIPKVPNHGSDENGHSPLTKLECIMWGEFDGIVSAPTREIAEQLYVQKVMCPLLGPDHVDAGLALLASGILSSPPLPIYPCTLKEDFCVSVEIKPKCGFLPISDFIAEENEVKKRITRFRMHQALKLSQGQISQISKYNPLDLFSGSKDRVQKAIKSLFLTPQNNFRVFLNGSLIFGGMDGSADSPSYMFDRAFQDALKHVILARDGMHSKYFMELVAETVMRSGLLDKLLEVQKLDAIDIEGAIHAYYDVVSKPCVICLDKGRKKLAGRYSSIHAMPRDKKFKLVMDYLISATGKDLSVMVSFRSRGDKDPESPYNVVYLEPTKQTFDFKASFIDLDMKPLKKMKRYYELDQQIVSFYLQMEKDKEAMDFGESIEESSKSCMAKC
ncbi:inositol-pentakisphosphate 2-kinase [Phtheirospermum japonicum]|uniref:Inositol-pentakisphosphate 2-kinase n=1 Tax=Phtheirospermum japonicum TaxID=374723 RepID=A0A830CCA4_9LAMI|nr:inositol-pentakisphosphate 2-kinase [Phtheirospermum japonicum]